MNPEKVQNLRNGAEIDVFVDVAIKLNTRKQEFEVERATAICNGIRFKKHTPRWDKIEREIIAEAVRERRDKTGKNTLLLIREGIAYLDFISACRSGFNGRVEKCVEYFAILYQGLSLKNYAGETMHMVACFRRLWNEEFR